jgi:PHD/YefM family antitoxin component YafN of YafNO toxin-antitoxin module
MTIAEAYRVAHQETDLLKRLPARYEILKHGMRDVGDAARQIQMAEALADIALALSRLLPPT